jgi:hypothetical protein
MSDPSKAPLFTATWDLTTWHRRMKGRLRQAATQGGIALTRSIHSYRGLLLFPHG